MKKFFLFTVLSVVMSSCITVKVYKMEPNSKVEPKKSIQKKSALISSGMIAPLMDGDTEIFFFGEDASELQSIDFSDSLVSPKHSNKRVFVFKTKDADEAIRWVTQLGDSLELQEQDASKFSGNSVIISEDKKNIRLNIQSDNAQPIIIIDGKEMDTDFDMDSLDVDTIESVDVLKGQKALQKVGAKGKNGVIIIRLKK
ncbi:Plug domain-containing protein [Flavobacteriaceae bacterium]|nr:Plug domain-containing protein [Flavobacteriaceae bacterium]